MQYLISSLHAAVAVVVRLRARTACIVHTTAQDNDVPGAVLARRFDPLTAGEEKTLVLQMPLTGKNTWLTIAEKDGTQGRFTVEGLEVKSLPEQLDVVRSFNPNVRAFLRLAGRFAFNQSALRTGQTYVSDGGHIRIRFLDAIRDGGQEVPTPARIDLDTRLIEVSRRLTGGMPVPQLMVILCHEFAHSYLNRVELDELEADLNGLTMYLGSGFPRYDALETYRTIFYGGGSGHAADERQRAEQEERWTHIQHFIYHFETLNIQLT